MIANWFFTDGIVGDGLPFLIQGALKSAVLLSVTALIVASMGKRSAATKHRVWAIGFAGCLVIPWVTLIAPSWSPPVPTTTLIAATTDSPPTAPAELTKTPKPVAANGTAAAEPLGPSVATEATGGFPAFAATPKASMPMPPHPSATTTNPTYSKTSGGGRLDLPWTALAITVWLMGVAFFLSRLAWQHLMMGRMTRSCTPLDDDAWKQAVEDASNRLGLRRSVAIMKSPLAQSPSCSGVVRATVVMPSDAEGWPSERRRLVLLHELAHICRHDVLTQTVAAIVCAIHWFNPIGWVGLSQMRRLRELACDDLVLGSGQRAVDYADVLLDVARRYRHRELSGTVGMVRRSGLEQRIGAVLDRARSHANLSRRGARAMLAIASAIVMLIGSMRLQSQDVSPVLLPPTPLGQVNGEDQDPLRPMIVYVRDESGKPIPDAMVHVGLWYVKGYTGPRVSKAYRSDENGIVPLKIPKELLILRLWASQIEFVPEFVNFARGTHDEGKRIPGSFEFRLARGTKLSGRVVDTQGEPINGVRVSVSVDVDEPAWGVDPDPMISRWLTDSDFNDTSPVTDDEGRWELKNAPARRSGEDYQFSLKLQHANYASDKRWGGLQVQQGIKTKHLRAGTAEIAMETGVRLSGTVFGSDGQPVSRGLVIWNDDPYHGSEVNEVQITPSGRFETIPLSPGEYPITVIAPGHGPTRKMVTIDDASHEQDFRLPTGQLLSIQIIDRSGVPVPDAYVSLRGWRGAESLYNWKHSNVPLSGIPRRSDGDGLYVWDWAPDDAVTYMVSQEGYSSNEVTLTASTEPHVVILDQALVATGAVTDATTGLPLREFQVTPVKEFRPKFMTTLFRDTVPGKDGSYTVELSDNAERDERFRVRFSADGYRSILSERSYGMDEGQFRLDVALKPAAGRTGKVIDANGQPVARAMIIEASPSILPDLNNGDLSFGGRHDTSGDDGSFTLAATSETVRLQFHHDAGFADVELAPSDSIGTIPLQPWASVSGQLVQQGKPIADQWVYFYPVHRRDLGEPRFQESYNTRTDENGRFQFAKLPPIQGYLRGLLSPWQESPLNSSQSVPLDLKPGENRTVSLGGEGISVTGRVVVTGRDEATLNQNWSLNYLIRRGGGIDLPPNVQPGFDPDQPVQANWFLDPAHHTWLATRPNHFVKLSPDGQFTISGVTEGTYDLAFRLYEQPAGCLVEAVGERVIPVQVSKQDIERGSKKVDAIEVACRAGPRVGQDMRAYRFTDTTGRLRTIGEMSGRHVVMHVWASWCAPCLKSLPDMKSTLDAMDGQPVTFVGMNVDTDKPMARDLAERNGWDWSQEFLGDQSDVARQLAISTVPTYYLIGPDGRLLASSGEWSDFREQLTSALGQ